MRQPAYAPGVLHSVCEFIHSKPAVVSPELNVPDTHRTALATLCAALPQLAQRTSLTLDDMWFRAAATSALAKALSRLVRLQCFSLSSGYLHAAGAPGVMVSLAALTALRSLALNSTHIGAAAAQATAGSIPQMTRLTRLGLHAARVTTALTRSQSLQLGGSLFSEASIAALSVSLFSLTALWQLDLRGSQT